MTAPDQMQNVKLTLAKREPSTHDPKRTFEKQLPGRWIVLILRRYVTEQGENFVDGFAIVSEWKFDMG